MTENQTSFDDLIKLAVEAARKEGNQIQLHFAYRPEEAGETERWAAAIGYAYDDLPRYTATGRNMEIALMQLLVEMGIFTVQAQQ